MIVLRQKPGVWREVLPVMEAGRESITVNPRGNRIEDTERRVAKYDGPPALIIWSSGTTGEPKGVVLPWETVRVRCQQVIDGLGYGPSSVVFGGGLGCHNFGMVSAALAAHFAGAKLVEAADPYKPVTIQKALAETFCTHVLLLTFQAAHMVRNCLLDGVRAERIYLGGSPVSEELRAALSEATGATVFNSLGTSETGTIAKSDGRALDGWLAPYRSNIEARRVDGHLEWRTPGLAWGTVEKGPLPLTDGWWRSGDLGSVEDGKVLLAGRA